MDHEIQNDRHVGSPGLVGRDAGGLDVKRGLDPLGDGPVFCRVTQQMADLKDFACLLRQISKGVRFVQSGSYGFLDQNMPPGPERLACQDEVILRWSGNDDSLDLIQKIFIACGNFATCFTGHDRRAVRIGVEEGNELLRRVCGGFEGMEPSEMTGPDDADPKLLRCVHADTLIRERLSRKGSVAPKRQKVASAWRKRHGPGLKMI